MTLRNTHPLSLQTCKYVWFHKQKVFADVNKVKDFEGWDIINYQGESKLLAWALKSRKGSAVEGRRHEAEVKVREAWTMRVMGPAFAGFEDEGSQAWLQEALLCTVSSWEPQGRERDFLPDAPWESPALPWGPRKENSQAHPDFWNMIS